MDSVLQVTGVSRKFGGLDALSNMNFDLNSGEILGLIGPNGAGKTTCFNLIGGAMPPSAGRICLKGRDITGMSPHRIVARGLSRTFQSATVYPRATALENVVRGMSTRYPTGFFHSLLNTKRCRRVMAQVYEEAWDILEEMSLSRAAHIPGGNLAYGDQKRLGIAIAIATSPNVLLLDEPVAGLNPEESSQFGRSIRELRERRGLSILMVEHHMRLVMELCDRIVVLNQGKKLAEGTPAEIRNHSAVIEAYLGSGDDGDN